MQNHVRYSNRQSKRMAQQARKAGSVTTMQQHLRYPKRQSKRVAQQYRKKGLVLQAAYIERSHSCHPFQEPENQTSVDDFRTFHELWDLVRLELPTLAEESIDTVLPDYLTDNDKQYLCKLFPSLGGFGALQDQEKKLEPKEKELSYRAAGKDLLKIVDTFATNPNREIIPINAGTLESLFSLVRILLSCHHPRVARKLALKAHQSFLRENEMTGEKTFDEMAEKSGINTEKASPKRKRSYPCEADDYAEFERLAKRLKLQPDPVTTIETIVYMVDLDPPRYVSANTTDDSQPVDDNIPPLILPPSIADDDEPSATSRRQEAAAGNDADIAEAQEQPNTAKLEDATSNEGENEQAELEGEVAEFEVSEAAMFAFQLGDIVVPQLWRSGYTINMIANELCNEVESAASRFAGDLTFDHYLAIVDEMIEANPGWGKSLRNPLVTKVRRQI